MKTRFVIAGAAFGVIFLIALIVVSCFSVPSESAFEGPLPGPFEILLAAMFVSVITAMYAAAGAIVGLLFGWLYSLCSSTGRIKHG